jgi:hypothetical protein
VARELGVIVGNDSAWDAETREDIALHKILCSHCGDLVKGSASIHLVKMSMAMMRNLNPLGAVEIGPSKSSPQVTNN